MERTWVSRWLSPSRCDQFTQYLTGDLYSGYGDNPPEFTTEIFIDKLLKIENPANFRKANAGSAVHRSLELAKYCELPDSWIMDGWKIIIDCDISLNLPQCREVWVDGKIAGHNILGKVDAIDSIAVHDLKTTGKIDLEKFMHSWQWKMYLMMTGLDKFIYDVFKVKVDDNQNIITIEEYHKLELFRYDGMEQNVTDMIIDYAETLVMLKPQIIARRDEYNNKLDKLIIDLTTAKEWAFPSLLVLDKSINEIEQSKILIKGLDL